MNISDINRFVAPTLGDVVNDSGYPIQDPEGSRSGTEFQSIGPGLKLYVFPDGQKVVTDEAGNILG